MFNSPDEEKDVCPICKGLGFVFTKGRGVRKCKCLLEKFDMVKFLNIPERYRYANLKGVQEILDLQNWNKLRNYLRDFAHYYKNGVGLLFIGPPGVGKTYISCAVLKYLYQKYRLPGYFTDTKELAIKLRKAFESDEASKVLNALFKIPILVLDDLGNETLNDWYKEILTSIITSRYNNKKLTFVTTNYYPLYSFQKDEERTPDGMVVKKKDGENGNKKAQDLPTLDSRYGSHIVSRLSEMTMPFYLYGKDYRKVKGVVYHQPK